MIKTLIAFCRRFERLARYIVVGGGIALVYAASTAGLIAGGMIPVLASAIGSLVTLPLSFFAHRAVTYADIAADGSQFGRFAVTAAMTTALNVGLMTTAGAYCLPYWIALATGWVVVPVVNYGINSLWVFRVGRLFSLERDHA